MTDTVFAALIIGMLLGGAAFVAALLSGVHFLVALAAYSLIGAAGLVGAATLAAFARGGETGDV
ncbi:hypothetical protein [Oceanicella actignis]|uniref:Uncharacterized protein n=1 Tax=Oceanicella actignis TaxID=1189325 RepID=A0A1M7TSE9_9RHOB|nr:hypothetical protein [Oceanicella actignis]TYO85399.1 hypothetical protein LY05_02510 [Oceanicella actignis]SET76777.1 hypothetical protein SAMN04488119_10945 [Oceanicella actignis]SHN73645.1 hypothetical protein SAMN05216200_10977 [Oceanicella actignis]